MPDAWRGARWRVAWLVAAVLSLLLWRACDRGSAVVQIEFGAAPDLFTGAQVLVDGQAVGKLARTRSRTRRGFRVTPGDHVVEIRGAGCGSQPATVIAGPGAPVVLLADMRTYVEAGGQRCVFALVR